MSKILERGMRVEKGEVLVTGGAGYIGSHTCLELQDAGYKPIVLDNLSNSNQESLRRVESITGQPLTFYRADVTDRQALADVVNKHSFCAAIHFAGLKAVGESSDIPLRYYHNNVEGSVALAEVLGEHGIDKLIFSSSATVYGDPQSVPIDESFPTSVTNPYGRSKLMVEEIYQDLCRVPNNQWKITLLRYFNPIGAHVSGKIGEDPQGIPNNLLPYVAQVAVGKLPHLNVFGDDYSTPDGTGVRDYIHVVDLARGHVKALEHLLTTAEPGCNTFNLGTGQGYSVLEMVEAFRKVSGKEIPYKIAPRRLGDIAECYANPKHAADTLNWQAESGIQRMVEDAWRWQSQNPQGYSK